MDEFIKNDILRLTERNILLDYQLEFFRSISLRSTSEIIMLPTSEFKNGFNTKIKIIIDLNNYIIKNSKCTT